MEYNLKQLAVFIVGLAFFVLFTTRYLFGDISIHLEDKYLNTRHHIETIHKI